MGEGFKLRTDDHIKERVEHVLAVGPSTETTPSEAQYATDLARHMAVAQPALNLNGLLDLPRGISVWAQATSRLFESLIFTAAIGSVVAMACSLESPRARLPLDLEVRERLCPQGLSTARSSLNRQSRYRAVLASAL